ncbi:HpcH/HpaI aldolase family protein [Planctomonas psychrotolerans]|uniref:HpcH/HpaI aldolase family protein n=1 Tax=Planctomonas psychrotolerans TaxID=2528712 RepID=UPI00123C29E5|nr:aldolase/citrate lyase family protein [Planctomonas psychrotolerans]
MSGRIEYGAFSFAGSGPIVAGLAASGLDWVCIDAQHGRWNDDSVLTVLDLVHWTPGADATRMYVRPRALDFGLIGRALDAGAAGIIVPMVDSVDDARRAVEAARFPPLGRRSFGPIRTPFGAPDDLEAANAGVIVVPMIETVGALDQVEDIAAVDGVDMLFVGPFDLSLALGTTVDALLADTSPGNPLDRIAAAADAAGVRFGAFAGSLDRARAFQDRGADFLSVISDLDAAVTGAQHAVRAVRDDGR